METTEYGPFGLIPFAKACQLLGVHERTGRRWLREKNGDFPRPSVKLGRKRYYRSEDELRAWLDRQAERARAAA
jgi:predicted DNA-binding transcriptional regulator AlpA